MDIMHDKQRIAKTLCHQIRNSFNLKENYIEEFNSIMI